MKMERKYKPQLAVSDDTTRGMLTQVQLDAVNKVAVATCGHFLVQVPVDPEENKSGPIPTEALKQAAKLDKDHADLSVDLGANSARLTNGTTFPREDRGKFPEYQRVIPGVRDGEVSIAFNAKYLATIAEALGVKKGDGVTITFDPANSHGPIVVRAQQDSKALGVLMPMRV